MTRAVAFIPARSGSKRILNKNRETVGGVTLVDRAIRAAVGAGCEPVVSTDDPEIASWYTTRWMPPAPRVTVHERPAQLASDHAQIEDAVGHWWRRLDTKPDVIVILQPTSPFRTSEHVSHAIALLHGADLDSVVGVVASHDPHFAGRLKPRLGDEEGGGPASWFEWHPFSSVEHASSRPRTQDLTPRGVECGALYAFTREHWERTGNRLGGRMAALPMTRWEGLDIDTQDDLAIARAIAEARGW